MSTDYIKMQPGQDRDLDHQTVQWFCTGCPFLGLKPKPSHAAANAETDERPFSAAGANYGTRTKTQYVCTSLPPQNIKQYLAQDNSTIGFGYCPFFDSKWSLLNDKES
jgi:hypothetical protein